MTKDDTIKLAREAGFADGVAEIVGLAGFANFANLVAAHEREAILDLVDGYAKNNTDLAEAIRARGTT